MVFCRHHDRIVVTFPVDEIRERFHLPVILGCTLYTQYVYIVYVTLYRGSREIRFAIGRGHLEI